MSLKIKEINLSNWRNFTDYSLELSPGLTVLVGLNASGKTNTVEALQYLTAGTSFRKPSPFELISQGASCAQISARILGDGRVIDVGMKVKERSRSFFKNNKSVKNSEFIDVLPSVLFCPDDLLLIKGSASKRRNELDDFGIQINSGYRRIYSTYIRSIEQRNHLLKEGIGDILLDSWDESVALGAATLLQLRLRLFNKLSQLVEQIYKEVVSNEELTCEYISSLPGLINSKEGLQLPTGDVVANVNRDVLAHYIEKLLYTSRDQDLHRGQTLIGPHRDDISFKIDDKEARTFGSQGQQRSIVLAWKMAEVRFCEQLFNSCPLLLLDDVMSELDENRRSCITQFISQDIQTVITTTNLGYFKESQLKRAKVVTYGGETTA